MFGSCRTVLCPGNILRENYDVLCNVDFVLALSLPVAMPLFPCGGIAVACNTKLSVLEDFCISGHTRSPLKTGSEDALLHNQHPEPVRAE